MKTKPKHTPGPWKFTEVNQSDGGKLLIVDTDAPNANGFKPEHARSVAIMTGRVYHNSEDQFFDAENLATSKANAHLIAAAPELKEAVEALFEEFYSSGQWIVCQGNNPDRAGAVLQQARNAIAKAEGNAS